MLNDSGISDLVLNVVHSERQSGAVIAACFRFLSRVAFKNKYIQKHLFPEVPRLLSWQPFLDSGWQADFGNFIAATLHDNAELCNDLTLRDFEHIFGFICTHGSQATSMLTAITFVFLAMPDQQFDHRLENR